MLGMPAADTQVAQVPVDTNAGNTVDKAYFLLEGSCIAWTHTKAEGAWS